MSATAETSFAERIRITAMQQRALHSVGMSLHTFAYTRRSQRARLIRVLKGHVSHNALRVQGVLNGRINLNTLNIIAKHAGIDLGPR